MPDTTIVSAPPAFTNAPNATFTFASSEPASQLYQCRLDAATTFTACPNPYTVVGVSEGLHTLLVRAGAAGTPPDPTPASHTWTVDFTPPDTTFTAQPPPLTASPAATFAFTSEAAATFECSLNGAAFTACASPQSFTGLSDAARTFTARAVDQAGNADPTPATSAWTVDATAPDTTITAGPSGPSKLTQPSFEFTANEPASLECGLDGAAFSACTSPHVLSGLADGAHSLAVRAVDGAGNVEATPAVRAWEKDTTAPPVAKVFVRPCRTVRGAGRAGCLPPQESGRKLTQPGVRFQTKTGLYVRWSSPGASHFDVAYYRTAYPQLADGADDPIAWKTNVTATGSPFAASSGKTYCFKPTSRDPLGNQSAAGARVCTTLPIKAKSLAKFGGNLTAHTGSGHYLNQYVQGSAGWLQLHFGLPGFGNGTPVPVKRIALVATKCPQCGKVRVLLFAGPGGLLVDKTLDLGAPKTRKRQLMTIKTFSEPHAIVGDLRIAPLDGKTMKIEGVGVAPR